MYDDIKNFFNSLTNSKAIAILIIIGFIVFAPSLFNGFVGDDEAQLLNNSLVHSVSNIPYLFLGGTFNLGGELNSGLYYKPVMSSLFALIYDFFGANAFPYHLLQVVLHISNSIILLFVFRRFFNIYISVILALVFLIHPINVESVAYISDLQDILFFFFGNLALYLEIYMKYSPKKLLVISVLLLLSLFSKESGVLFIAAVAGYEFLFNRQKIWELLTANGIVLGIYAFFRIAVANIGVGKDSSSPIMHITVGERLFNVPSILLYYFKTFIFPLQLSVAQVWLIPKENVAFFLLSLLVMCLIIAFLIWLGYYLHKKYRKDFIIYVFFVFILCIGLLLHSQIFITLDGTVADRWFYFPIVGFLGIIGIILKLNWQRLQRFPFVVVFIVISIFILLSIRSIIRTTNFHDNYSLTSHDIKYSEDSSLLLSFYGKELMDRGEYKEAEYYLVKATKLDPEGQVVWNTLGVFYEAAGSPEKAFNAYNNSIKNGGSLEAYHNLALLLLINEHVQEAEKVVKESLIKFPSNGQLWQLYALIENKLGKEIEAIGAARNAMIYNPTPLTSAIYNSLLQGQSVNLKIIPSTGKSKSIQVCLPNCE